MSMMHAAELAGLGTRSFAAHIILNPEYGLLYYAALINHAAAAGRPAAGRACVPAPGLRGHVQAHRHHPLPARVPGVLSGTLKDARIETSTYDREKCHSRAQTYGIGSFQKALLAVVNEDDAGRRREMIHSTSSRSPCSRSGSSATRSRSASSACASAPSAASTGS